MNPGIKQSIFCQHTRVEKFKVILNKGEKDKVVKKHIWYKVIHGPINQIGIKFNYL